MAAHFESEMSPMSERRVLCPSCKIVLKVAEANAEQAMKCPKCGNAFCVPAAWPPRTTPQSVPTPRPASPSAQLVPAMPHPEEPAPPVPLQSVPRPPDQTIPIPEHRREVQLEAYPTEPVAMPSVPELSSSSINTDIRWRGINPYLTGVTIGIIALLIGFLIGFVFLVVSYLRYAD
jgi:hypothetical protein